jgi:leucyl-tRNA synthetase
MVVYDNLKIEAKWRRRWRESRIYQPDIFKTSKPFYNLMMFPYPSAEGLHVGNMYAFTGADVYGRFQRMQGKDVFEPIGLDGFGIHSENYAISIGKHPAEQAKVSEKRFYKQLTEIGNGFAWDQRLETYDPDYYRFTQWIFIQMFKNGLAYRKAASVNWCPSCKTVLADEQVEGGVCERCKTPTTRKRNEQWFFKITEYADRLLQNIDPSSHESSKGRSGKDHSGSGTQIGNRDKGSTPGVKALYGPVGKGYDPRKDGLRWPEKIKIAQRNWIGRKEGIDITYPVKGSRETLECFTTRPDTNFGATFVVLAPEYPLVASLLNNKLKVSNSKLKEVHNYVDKALKKTEQQRKMEERKKTGVFTGLYAVNQLNGFEMPIWVSDFVLMEVGTGAVVGVPGHDKRDFEFAQAYDLPVARVVVGSDGDESPITRIEQVQEEEGVMINSEFLNGMDIQEATQAMMDHIEEKGWGKRNVSYHLRDWLISRQRYWGPPIPMIFCQRCADKKQSWFTTDEARKSWENSKHQVPNVKQAQNSNDQFSKRKDKFGNWNLGLDHSMRSMAGWYPVPEEELPVELPHVKDYKPTGDGRSPLEKAAESWLYTKCPECGGKAKRETDVSDTFLDSSWYFLRYPSVIKSTSGESLRQAQGKLATPEVKEANLEVKDRLPWNREVTKKWLPVDAYIGGAEHAVLHLLYSRFVTMALHDWGYLDFEEPFPFLYSHGMLIKDGAKMSKSRGNIVVPDDYIRKFGSDAFRTYLMFLGPYDRGGDFKDTGIAGMNRFLKRVWRLFQGSQKSLRAGPEAKVKSQKSDRLVRPFNRTIKKVTEDIEKLRYNTAIAALMEFVNEWEGILRQSGSSHGSRSAQDDKTGLKSLPVLSRDDAIKFLKLLAPFAPHMTEELFQILRKSKVHAKGRAGKSPSGPGQRQNSKFSSIHAEPWPGYDEKLVKFKEVEIPVQVNGKLRGTVVVSFDKAGDKEVVVKEAKKNERVLRYIKGKKIGKTIWVPGRLVSFVTS